MQQGSISGRSGAEIYAWGLCMVRDKCEAPVAFAASLECCRHELHPALPVLGAHEEAPRWSGVFKLSGLLPCL